MACNTDTATFQPTWDFGNVLQPTIAHIKSPIDVAGSFLFNTMSHNLTVQVFRLLRRFNLLRPRMQYLRPYPIGFSISWRCRLFLGTRLGFLHQFYLHFEIHEHEPVPGVSPRHIAQCHRSPPQ